MSLIDPTSYYASIAAGNSSQQMVETMELHRTLRALTTETEELHKTIRCQIEATNKQERLIWRLSIIVAILALVQAAGTVIQVWPVPEKPHQGTNTNNELRHPDGKKNEIPRVVIQNKPPSEKTP